MGKHPRSPGITFELEETRARSAHQRWAVRTQAASLYAARGWVSWSERHRGYTFEGAPSMQHDPLVLRAVAKFCAERTREFWDVVKEGGDK